MRSMIIGLLAETFIHPGVGSNEGAIDLPVAREAATDHPYLPGSSLKGALRDYSRAFWNDENKENKKKIDRCFGDEQQENAGGILVSDARLLLLPVRCLTGNYKWLTCPLILERLGRDLKRAGHPVTVAPTTSPPDGKYLGNNDGTLFLEERTFDHDGELPDHLTTQLAKFIHHDQTRKRLNKQLLVVNDADFSWFARYALSVQARNQLDENKQSKNLWYEESLPPDTLMYSLLGERVSDSGMDDLMSLFEKKPYLQTGGNETVGMGWFALQPWQNSEDSGDEH